MNGSGSMDIKKAFLLKNAFFLKSFFYLFTGNNYCFNFC